MNDEMIEKDLNIYDVWEASNGNLFIKMTDECSIAIGPKGNHGSKTENEEKHCYRKTSKTLQVKKVGKIIFDN